MAYIMTTKFASNRDRHSESYWQKVQYCARSLYRLTSPVRFDRVVIR